MLPGTAQVWTVGMKDVQLVHVSTRKVLSVTGERYPDWGENMTEVVTAKADKMVGDNKWTADFIRYPKYSQ